MMKDKPCNCKQNVTFDKINKLYSKNNDYKNETKNNSILLLIINSILIIVCFCAIPLFLLFILIRGIFYKKPLTINITKLQKIHG